MNEQIQQLRSLANQVRAYQLERGWSDARLCKEIPDIGSSKTYKRILDPQDDLEQLSIENQIKNYEGAVLLITARAKSDRPAEPEYEDFANVRNVYGAVLRATMEDQECVARLVIVEGNTATGKDTAIRFLQKKLPLSLAVVEATEFWRESLEAPSKTIYHAVVGVKQADRETKEPPKPPRYPLQTVAAIINELRERKMVLVINEAHHLGPRGLNLVKTLINQTPAVIVLACIPALLTRVLSTNYEEAIQLTGNRLCERIYLPPPPVEEILLLLDRRGMKFDEPKTRSGAAQALAEEAPNFGNWRFIAQVARKLHEAMRRGPVGVKQVNQAMREVQALRTRITRETQN